jgi:hypothetical protein
MRPCLLTLLKDRSRLFSTIKYIENQPKKFDKLKKIFTLKNTLKFLNSLKFVEINFKKDTEPKINQFEETSALDPKPLFYIMPPIIRKEFDKFNGTILESKVVEAKFKDEISQKEEARMYQFLPDINFMNQVMKFRNGQNPLEKKSLNHTSGLTNFFKQIFKKKTRPNNNEITANPTNMTPNFGRKISLLGFHGWFPNKLIQKVIGDPRGTSTRIVDMLETAVNENDPFPPYCEGPASIYKFALKGEGTIEERVLKHFEELQNVPINYYHEGLTSIQHLKESNTIILGAHSQGAPVAIILLAKLLDSGIINLEKQNVAVLTVAGIFHGPFPALRKNLVVQYVEADAARQLFDLNNPDSDVSKLFATSLDKVLRAGVNITCVASWLDQVVPFYSACLLGFEHPNIWRSVHINADHYRPDFLTKLVATGLKIKNTLPSIGEPETHMILAEISEYISGSIYQHVTHSSAYRKMDSYKAALEWMKLGPKTKNIPIQAVDHIRHRPLQSTVNPYYLPWLFRGWLNSPELLNNTLLRDEVIELQRLYKDWKPDSKLLKDFKFKLEPISLLSKL